MTEEEINHILYSTTTGRDYVPKGYCKRDPIRPVINKFEEPITSAFTKFLTIDAEVKSPIEDGDEYYEKVKQIKSKKIQELHLKDPIDHAIVKEDKMMGMATEYQVEYRSLGIQDKERILKIKTEHFKLPENWIIPETTQRREHRNPVLLNESALDPPLIIIPPDSLGQNEKINEILQVRTGTSTYEDTYSKFGEFAIRNQIHGKITYPK
ncbi:uncharacterized protein LOC126884258 isoform X2 [Diabrotica virgifera virgifera]|uniref:Uncharacterized protein LOC114338804 isoform X1 n=1 Tax=Diabrotica virgifera virgifera TaxID=50390 RepID=A0A6P7G835_DIAVI|nr:uncharacterized protein LOC126884258 isoform X2 [Diabrotica virgifera virgifera]